MQKEQPSKLWFYHRVSYGETDTMGYLYYAEYFHIFERARNELIRHLGMSYAEIELKGIMLPVYKAHCHYYKPIYYDDLLHIYTSIHEIKKASLTISYSVMDTSHNKLLSKGSTKHVCTKKDGQPTKFPPWFLNIISNIP